MVTQPSRLVVDRQAQAAARGNRWVGGKFGTERSGFGVDISGLRAHLQLTPEERLVRMVAVARFVDEGRRVLHPARQEPARRFNPRELWCRLAAEQVDYLVIGGGAAALQGSNYATDDVEILLDPSPANLARLSRTVHALEGRSTDLAPEAPARTRGRVHDWLTPFASLRCWESLPGVGYCELHHRAITMDLGPCRVKVTGLDDLIVIQGSGEEPADRLLLEDLRELRQLIAEGTSATAPNGR